MRFSMQLYAKRENIRMACQVQPAGRVALLGWTGWPFVSFLLILGWIVYLVCKTYKR